MAHFDPTALRFLNRGDEIYEGNTVIDTETNILHVCATQRVGKQKRTTFRLEVDAN